MIPSIIMGGERIAIEDIEIVVTERGSIETTTKPKPQPPVMPSFKVAESATEDWTPFYIMAAIIGVLFITFMYSFIDTGRRVVDFENQQQYMRQYDRSR